MFSECKALVSLDLSKFKTGQVTLMERLFYGCQNLKNIQLSKDFKTDKVISMDQMFGFCQALVSIDLTNFDSSKV